MSMSMWIKALAVSGMALLPVPTRLAAIEVSGELIAQIQQDVEQIEKEGPEMGVVMAALREAGASYLPEIVAPVDVDNYQSPERRRLMLGVYLMDLTYAATFDQRRSAAEYGEAVYQLLESLGFPQPDMERRYREALDQIDLPGGEERLRQLFKEQDKDTAWQQMLHTGEGVAIVLDGLYGFLIEGLFITAELCALSDYNPGFMQYVGEMRDSFLVYRRLLLLFEDYPELAEAVQQDTRLNFLTYLLSILGELPYITDEQVDALRPVVAKARREMVR